MTRQEGETDSKWSEIRLWAVVLLAVVVVVFSLVGFVSVDNLIVREDGSITKGSRIAGRVHHYLAPRIQGQRFWREQLVIVRERLYHENGAVERHADELRRREQKLAQTLQALTIAANKERSALQTIDPSTGQTLYERSMDVANKSFEEDVERIVTRINQQPERYQRLKAIEQAILMRLEK